MEIGGWVSQNWFNLFSVIGIIAGLWFTAFSLRSETKTRRVANLLTITANHREIWKEFLNNPKLARVRDGAADTVKQPVTDAERVFVNLVIQHINSVYYTMSASWSSNMKDCAGTLHNFSRCRFHKRFGTG